MAWLRASGLMDTSMALCLADSLLTCGEFDAVDQLQRYLRWRREGYLSSNGHCFDVGGTVDQVCSAKSRSSGTRSSFLRFTAEFWHRTG